MYEKVHELVWIKLNEFSDFDNIAISLSYCRRVKFVWWLITSFVLTLNFVWAVTPGLFLGLIFPTSVEIIYVLLLSSACVRLPFPIIQDVSKLYMSDVQA